MGFWYSFSQLTIIFPFRFLTLIEGSTFWPDTDRFPITKKNKKWQSQITFDRKIIYIGTFDNIEDAKIARQKKAAELFGEFLNEIEK